MSRLAGLSYVWTEWPKYGTQNIAGSLFVQTASTVVETEGVLGLHVERERGLLQYNMYLARSVSNRGGD